MRQALHFSALVFLLILSACSHASPRLELRDAAKEEEARDYLEALEPRYSEACNIQMTARWAYITDVNDDTSAESEAALNDFLQFQSQIQSEINDQFPDWNQFSDAQLKREFEFLASKGPANMDPKLVAEMNKLMGEMEGAYAVATVCEYKNNSKCDLRLEPEIEEKLRTVTDFDELSHYWTAWHNAMNSAVPTTKYARFIQLQNEMAKANKYTNMGAMWDAPYSNGSSEWTSATFEEEMLSIWEDLRPYYNKLHAYVRMKLRQLPELESHISRFGYLPASVMGNMWAQDWTALDSRTKPYPLAPSLDATQAMIKAGYTPHTMFEKADEFFTGLGLLEMTETFWNESMLERPLDKEVVCHASAEDFCLGLNSTDFRIKMCTEVNQDDLVTVHHEMGHIEYFMQYTDKHFIFRDGANPGFHEAIGDALALAVATPKHLQCALNLDLGLDIDCDSTDPEKVNVTETDINFLYRMGLEKFSFFPFAISMDSWRWGVFDGSIPESEYNSKWWEIRQKNQGIAPPSDRSGISGGLDAAAKYHIVANVEYIRYFISHILQFQFYEAMCIAAGEYDPENPNSKPLYQCDFAGSQEAGKKFGEMMQLGFTLPWPEALQVLTGSKEMSIDSLLNYFQPLFQYMDEQLEANGEFVGFGSEFQEEIAAKYVNEDYEQEATRLCNWASVADFQLQTNLTSLEAEAEAIQAATALANFELDQYKNFISHFEYEGFEDEKLKRQLRFMSAIGTSALSEEDFLRYQKVLSEMSNIYGTAKVCPYTKQDCDLEQEGLALEPHLTEILGKMENFNEMAYLWRGWRDASGKQMRDLYEEYVQLSNKAALANDLNDMGEFWLLRYESDTFKSDMDRVYKDVQEKLYEPLYSYVRHRLSQHFSQMDGSKMIPAHVLGNMWAQTWEYVLPFVVPYPNASTFDITQRLEQEGNDPSYPDELSKRRYIFNMANGFFKDLGLADMSVAYGENAMIVKPEDREVICHASAWDMCDGKDFRIKMCTEMNHQDFITVHHELGHIQYYLQYKDQPITFRTGANPGFHEAIGDVVALSVSTPEHLKQVGLLTGDVNDESMLNYLMQMALDKIAFLPFGYLIDSYRWQIFNGEISSTNYTYNWLKMRAEFQGIVPPFARNESDFDAGAKYHVPANTPYIRYFVSYILQFQIHKRLCEEAGHKGPLHECHISNNQAAGKLFKKILEAGGSKNWQELLEETTGEKTLNADAIISYFQPLLNFLNETATTEKYPRSWDPLEFEEYFGDEDPATPSPATTPPVETTEDGDGGVGTGSTEPSDVESTSSSSSTPSSNNTDEDEGTDVAAIVVGIVLAAVVVVIVIGYFFGKKCRKSS